MAKAKKEIDKEVMYQKIIPSAMRSGAEGEDTQGAVPLAGVAAAAAAPREPVQPTEGLPIAPPPKAEECAAVVNIMERLVEEKLDLALQKFRCCTCEKCRSDITAIALNKLQPQYVVAEEALLEEAILDPQANAQAATALVQAILVVKAHPKH